MVAEKRKTLAAPRPVAISPGASDPAVEVTAPLLAVRDLWVEVASRRDRGAILRGVDLDVRPGELVGVVGETGSGKSTTALAIMRVLPETMRIPRGTIEFDGIDLAVMDEASMRRLRGSRLAMIFQDPRSHLNPVFPIGEQLIDVVRAHHGGRGSEKEAIRLLEQVNLPNARARLNTYPHQLSGGMAQRVMIAMALAGKPDLLIADEPTSALDVTVQAQILALLRRLATEQGLAVLLISHNVAAVAQVCDRVVVMYAGSVVESARISSLLDDPGHPYTQGLLAAVPKVGARAQDMRGIPGRVPNIFELPSGCCPFATRCPAVMPQCRTKAPPSFILGLEHSAACFLHE
jgi:peptide/nickel transport system ATP-binding protein